MEYYTHVKLICLLTLFCNTKCTTVRTSERSGVCRNKNEVKQCCAMYHLVNGDCVEHSYYCFCMAVLKGYTIKVEVCPNGTYRFQDDEVCTKCSSGMYGRFCAHKCNCEHNQICDPAEGCKCVDCVEEIVTTEKQPKNIFIKSEQDPVLLNYWLIVGVPCALIVISASVIFSMQIRILKRRRVGNIAISLNDLVNYTNNAGSSYDYIDENMMINMQIPRLGNMTSKQWKTDSNSSESLKAVNAEEDDGYLNPYTPPATNWKKETHVYNDGDDSKEVKENAGYLNPYQPLTKEWQRQTHVYDRGGDIRNQLTDENNETETLECK